jgi:hypothetical protein
MMTPPPLLTEEEVLSLLDGRHVRWRGDREGWVSLKHCGIAWRVHYRRGELLEVGWWTLGRGGTGQSAHGSTRRAVSARLVLRLEEEPIFAVEREAAEWLAARLPAGSDTRRQIQDSLENPPDDGYLGSVQIRSELELVRGVVSSSAAIGDAVPEGLIRLAQHAE